MTADIRTAAQWEAKREYPDNDTGRIVKRAAYRRGYLAGAARVTPTREQIAEVLAQGYQAKYQPEYRLHVNHHDLRAADAVLALMAGLAEWES